MNLWKDKWKPMLLEEAENPFESKDYIFEMKFDGIRAIIFISKEKLIIKTRNGHDITNLYPELQKIKEIIHKDVIVDGEIVTFDQGFPSFRKLEKRNHLKDSNKIKIQSLKNPVIFMCFDILYDEKDITNLPLTERKKRLDLLLENDVFVKVTYIEKEGITLFNTIKKMQLEGIVAKKKDSKYEPDIRTENWIKIKNIKEGKFYIGGYIDKKESSVISLLLAEKKKKEFYYVGKISISKKNKLFFQVKKESIRNNTLINNCKEDAVFINPNLRCTIEYLERTKSGILRHAKLKD